MLPNLYYTGKSISSLMWSSSNQTKTTGGQRPRVKSDFLLGGSNQSKTTRGQRPRVKSDFLLGDSSNQTKTTGGQRPRVKSDFLLATADVNSTDFLSVMEYNRNFTARLTRDIYTPGFR